jgi:hypothetical protein
MADDPDVASSSSKPAAAKDTRSDWITERIRSSLKVRDDVLAKLLQTDAK